MIKISLLPQKLRKKESTHRIKTTLPLFPVAIIVVLVVLALHVIFFLLSYDRKMQLNSLEKTWEKMQPLYKEVEEVKNDLSAKIDTAEAMETILAREVYLTEFLNKINQAIPRGLWLSRLSFSYTKLIIEGSVFSFGSEEVSIVNNFFNELKNDQFFLDNFKNFSLDSVQRRDVKQYEVLDFLLTAEIKKERFEIGISNNGKR